MITDTCLRNVEPSQPVLMGRWPYFSGEAGDCMSWISLSASLCLQELRVRDDAFYFYLPELWGNGAAFLVSMLPWRH